MNGADAIRLRAQVAVAAFSLVAMVVFIAAGIHYPQPFAVFTWSVNGELFLEGGARWGGRAIRRRRQER